MVVKNYFGWFRAKFSHHQSTSIKAEAGDEQDTWTTNLDDEEPKGTSVELKDTNANADVVRSASFRVLVPSIIAHLIVLFIPWEPIKKTPTEPIKFTLFYFWEQVIIYTYFDDLIRFESFSFIPKCILNAEKFTLCELCKDIEMPVLFGFIIMILVALEPPYLYFLDKTITYELFTIQMISSLLAFLMVLTMILLDYLYRTRLQLRNAKSVKLDDNEPKDENVKLEDAKVKLEDEKENAEQEDANTEHEDADAEHENLNVERKALRESKSGVNLIFRILVLCLITDLVWIVVILDPNDESFPEATAFTVFYCVEHTLLVTYFEILVNIEYYTMIPKCILRGDKFTLCELCKSIDPLVLFGYAVVILFAILPPFLYLLKRINFELMVIEITLSFLSSMFVIRTLLNQQSPENPKKKLVTEVSEDCLSVVSVREAQEIVREGQEIVREGQEIVRYFPAG